MQNSLSEEAYKVFDVWDEKGREEGGISYSHSAPHFTLVKFGEKRGRKDYGNAPSVGIE